MGTEKLVQVSILHVISNHAQGVILHTHTQEPDDVWVLES